MDMEFVFEDFDPDGSGFVTSKDLRRVARKLQWGLAQVFLVS